MPFFSMKTLMMLSAFLALGVVAPAVAEDVLPAFLRSQGIQSFDDMTRNKREGTVRMIWLIGDQAAVIVECDMMRRVAEKSMVSKKVGLKKESRALEASELSTMKFLCDRVEFAQMSAEDPYEGGLDGDSFIMEVHLSGNHWRFERWELFQDWKLPAMKGAVPDPFAKGAAAFAFQRKASAEEQLVMLAALMLHLNGLGEMLPVKK